MRVCIGLPSLLRVSCSSAGPIPSSRRLQDPAVPNALSRKMMQRIVSVQYEFPADVQPSPEARDLLARIFVADPLQRIRVHDILRHAWHTSIP